MKSWTRGKTLTQKTMHYTEEAYREFCACPYQLFLLQVQEVFLQQNSFSVSNIPPQKSGEKPKTPKK